MTKLVSWLRSIRKTLAAVWATLTPPALIGVLALAGVHIDAGIAALILGVGAAVLAPAAVYRAKANDPAPDAPAAPPGS